MHRFLVVMLVFASASVADEGKRFEIRPTPESSLPAGNKWALIVGINRYSDAEGINNLRFAVADAHLLAQALISAPKGFPAKNVVLMTDDSPEENLKPTRNQIIAQLTAWLALPAEEDTVLFYFSGHGLEADGKTYLLPSDAKVSNPVLTAIPLSYVYEQMRACKAKKKIVILDACHSGAGKDIATMSQAMARELESGQGLVTLASCDVDERSYEWAEKEHGAFTYFLVEALQGVADRDNDGLLWASEVNHYVWNETRRWAGRRGLKQTPRYHSDLSGEITLAAVPTAPDAPADREAPALELVEPATLRGGVTELRVGPEVARLSLVGLARDNVGVAEVTVDGRPVTLEAASRKDLRAVNWEGTAVRFATEVAVLPGDQDQKVEVQARDWRGNVKALSLVLKRKTLGDQLAGSIATQLAAQGDQILLVETLVQEMVEKGYEITVGEPKVTASANNPNVADLEVEVRATIKPEFMEHFMNALSAYEVGDGDIVVDLGYIRKEFSLSKEALQAFMAALDRRQLIVRAVNSEGKDVLNALARYGNNILDGWEFSGLCYTPRGGNAQQWRWTGIPIDQIKKIARIEAKVKLVGDPFEASDRPRIGVQVRDMPGRRGAMVVMVQEGSPAEKAGLQFGDIIRSIAGREVTSSEDITTAISNCSPGKKIEITIERKGQVEVLVVEPAVRR